MKVVAKRESLVAAAQSAARATSKNDRALSAVLIEADIRGLVITGTDRDLTIAASATAEVQDAGRVLVDGVTFASLAAAADGDSVQLQLEDGMLSVSSGRASWRLRTIANSDFPRVSHLEGGRTVDGAAFLSAVRRVLPAVSRDGTRPSLQGILFDAEGETLRLVATDGYRLNLLDTDLPITLFGKPVVVPGRALTELARVKVSEVAIAADDNQVTFTTPGLTVTSRLIEAAYPPYRQLIPADERTTVLTLDKESTLGAIKRVSLLADAKSHAVVLELDWTGARLVVNGEVGAASEQLDAQYNGDELRVGFNARYLTETLDSVTTESVSFTFDGALRPILARDGGYLGLLMPVKIA